MNNIQKVIKYVAIVVAISLVVGIASSILTGMLAITGISTLIDIVNDNVQTTNYTKEYTNIKSIEIDVKSINLEVVQSTEIKANIVRIEGIDIPVDFTLEEENEELKISGSNVKNGSKLVIYLSNDFYNLDIDIGAGNIQIKDIKINNLDLNTGAAETYISNLMVISSADIDSGAGEIVFENCSIANLDMDAGIGNVEYNGSLTGTNTVNCGVGNIEINLSKTNGTYKITAEKAIGELNVNGNKLSGMQTIGEGSNLLKISGGIGNINVTY